MFLWVLQCCWVGWCVCCLVCMFVLLCDLGGFDCWAFVLFCYFVWGLLWVWVLCCVLVDVFLVLILGWWLGFLGFGIDLVWCFLVTFVGVGFWVGVGFL